MKTHEKIRLMRELNHWSQEEMAEKLEMSPSGYARIERGETVLNVPRLTQIAHIFNIDLTDLLHDEQNMTIHIQNTNNNQCDISLYNQYSSENIKIEIEKLKLMLRHKEELLEQKQQELDMFKEMFALLKQQLER